MKRNIIIIPDSFKGSLSSLEVAEILDLTIKKNTKFDTICMPVADGGEGTIDCVLAVMGGSKVYLNVKSPEWLEIEAYYAIIPENIGLIEFAQSSGITKQSSYNTAKATSYGFGQMISDGLNKGIRNFYLGLGGSATTDGGCGMAAALGMRFIDKSGKSFVPTGGSLKDIVEIEDSLFDKRIYESSFTVLSDVNNPLYGKNGAAYVYSKQKGALDFELEILDDGLRHLGNLLTNKYGVNFCEISGSGAAGGAGCGCIAFLNAKIVSGIDTVLKLYRFDEYIKKCDLIVTGEGKIDSQSLMGKVLSGIRKKSNNIPIIAFCGQCELEKDVLSELGIHSVEIKTGNSVEESVRNAKDYLQKASDSFFSEFVKNLK